MSRTRWQPLATLGLSLFGLGVATYLTVTHYDTSVGLSCPGSGGVVNCEKVTTSAQSVILGIPVAVLGLAFFVAMTAVCLPMAWRSARRQVHLARLGLAITGIAMVIYLVIAELFLIGNICLWCTSVHVITFALFVIIATATPDLLAELPRQEANAAVP